MFVGRYKRRGMSLAMSNLSGIFLWGGSVRAISSFHTCFNFECFLFSDVRRNPFLVFNIASQEGNIEFKIKFIVIAPNAILVIGSRG